MTNFFNFDDLTWDEVANLPRDTPLVLPLGLGYDISTGLNASNAQLQNQLSDPERCGLLPSFPFGWRNSGIEIPEKVFMPYIINLLDSLRDDGFTNVYCLAPQGFDPQSSFMAHLSPFILRQSHASHVQAKPILPPDSERDKVILIPIGHTEQHGFHLPLSVDTIIIDAVAKGTVAFGKNKSFTLPVMPYGVSTHRASFAGTMNAGGRAFEDFWMAVIDTLVARGFNTYE